MLKNPNTYRHSSKRK